MDIKFTIFSFIAFILIINAIIMVANFFGVSFAVYGPYVLWIIALGIFYMILPNSKSVFSN